MPYDSRPTTEGGNRGIDIEFSRKANKGQFRVVGVDTFDGGDWVIGNRKSREKAILLAKSHCGGQMQKAYVYDDKGNCIWSGGTF